MTIPHPSLISHGVEIRGLYDGVAFWVLRDGSVVNRWEGIPGYEDRAAKVAEHMKEFLASE